MLHARRALITGTLYALAAGLMWGLVFVAPTMLNDYPAALLVVGRYLAFGLIALPLAWLDRKRLAELSRADWLQALKLSAVGKLLQQQPRCGGRHVVVVHYGAAVAALRVAVSHSAVEPLQPQKIGGQGVR